MTESRVFAAAAVLVFIGVALVSVGVALVAGIGWALIAAGPQLTAAAVSGAVVLLRDGSQ